MHQLWIIKMKPSGIPLTIPGTAWGHPWTRQSLSMGDDGERIPDAGIVSPLHSSHSMWSLAVPAPLNETLESKEKHPASESIVDI